jgi:hypothetical protein
MHRWCIVTPIGNGRSSQSKKEEQKEAKWVRNRMRYANKHPIQKRCQKDSIKPLQLNNGKTIVTNTVSVKSGDDPRHEEFDVCIAGNKDDTLLHVTPKGNGCSSQPKTKEQKEAKGNS